MMIYERFVGRWSDGRGLPILPPQPSSSFLCNRRTGCGAAGVVGIGAADCVLATVVDSPASLVGAAGWGVAGGTGGAVGASSGTLP